MPGRSPHRHSPPPPPMISRRSPVLRGRMRSPDRRRPIAEPSRSRRPADFRTGTVRRSRSPIEKARSLSPPIKRNLSSKRVRENLRRSPSPHSRKLSRSKSPVVLGYKAGPSTSGTSERFHTGSYEKERVQFRGPEGSIIDLKELKRIEVEIRRPQIPAGGSTHINRSITNPENIVPVHRPGMRGRDMPSSFPDKPDWAQDGDFHRHKDFQSESSRPISIRSEFVAEGSRERQSDEYRRIVAIDSAQNSARRGDRDKDRTRDGSRYSPPHYEEIPQPYYSRETRERPRSPGYSTATRRSPGRGEFYESREKIRDDRRDDLRHELDMRRRDDGHYPERQGSFERESDLRTRIIEKRSEPHHRHEDHHYERERRHEHLSPPLRERRRDSVDMMRPRGDVWERDIGGGERRKRQLSRDQEEVRIRGNGRERYDEFSEVPDRPRRFPFKSEHRPYFKNEGEFIPSAPIRGRGGPSVRRGYSGPFRGRSMSRGAPRGFRGGLFIRGGPPRGSFMGSRGGFIPRK